MTFNIIFKNVHFQSMNFQHWENVSLDIQKQKHRNREDVQKGNPRWFWNQNVQ